jgi:hypothetical protein
MKVHYNNLRGSARLALESAIATMTVGIEWQTALATAYTADSQARLGRDEAAIRARSEALDCIKR